MYPGTWLTSRASRLPPTPTPRSLEEDEVYKGRYSLFSGHGFSSVNVFTPRIAGHAASQKLLFVSLPWMVLMYLLALWITLSSIDVSLCAYIRPPKNPWDRLNSCRHFLAKSKGFSQGVVLAGATFVAIFLCAAMTTPACPDPFLRISISITRLNSLEQWLWVSTSCGLVLGLEVYMRILQRDHSKKRAHSLHRSSI